MRKKLIVLYNEDRKNPRNTWSGTSYSLRRALEKYVDIIFIDSNNNRFERLLLKIITNIGKFHSCYLLNKIYVFFYTRRINQKLKEYKNIPVLQIANKLILKNDFYLYHDLSYYCWISANEKIEKIGKKFEYGNLNLFCKNELERRIIEEEDLVSKAKRVYYMGNWVSNEMKQHYSYMKEKFYSVGGGLNNDFSISQCNKKKNQILFIGIDFERKGGPLVLEAFQILKKKYLKDASLIIVGCEERKQVDGVVWTGRVGREEISELFSASELFCMPSIFEAYGLVFLEALCFGIPVIARNDYEMPYFVKNGVNGYLLENEDAEKLAYYIYLALCDEPMKKRVLDESKKYIEQYSWNQVAKKIVSDIYGRD